MVAYCGTMISPSITDPALRDTLQSFADEIEASGITISDVDPDASLKARSGRLWYNAASSNLFIFSDTQGGYVRATGESKNYHSVRIYFPASIGAGAPSAPVVTLTWANLTQASTNAQYKGGLVLNDGTNISANTGAWQEEPPAAFNGNTSVVYWSDLTFQREGGSATTTVTGTTPRKHIHFDGLVTFSNIQNAVNTGVTSIDGGVITTDTLNANRIVANSIETMRIKTNAVSTSVGNAVGTAVIGTDISINVNIPNGFQENGVQHTILCNVHVFGMYNIFGSVGTGASMLLQPSIYIPSTGQTLPGSGVQYNSTDLMLGNNALSQYQIIGFNGTKGSTTQIQCRFRCTGISGITNGQRSGDINVLVVYR